MDLMGRIVAHMSTALSVPVSTEVPENRPQRFVTLNRNGGSIDRFLEYQRITVDAWDVSDERAAALIGAAIDAAIDMPYRIANVATVDAESAYRSDIDGAHRWSAVISVLANH